jgi:23S rRNA (cytosine1962-C5)-methyltransferase
MRTTPKTPPKKEETRLLPLTSSIDYELLDYGGRRKLERFGQLIVDRPESEAEGPISIAKREWDKADWHFYEEKGKKGTWTNKTNAPESWEIKYEYRDVKLTFDLKITAFKHLGIFQEQAENWKFMQRELATLKGEVKILNLFAYTGAASIVAAAAGAHVTNVDSVKQVLNWGRENAEKNQVENIRWILEDARKFVKKAIRRGDKFQGIIMDPPAFGLGSKNERWKLEDDLPELLDEVMQLLHPKRHFFILNTYSPKLPLQKLKNMLRKIDDFPTKYDSCLLGLKTASGKQIGLGNLIRFAK